MPPLGFLALRQDEAQGSGDESQAQAHAQAEACAAARADAHIASSASPPNERRAAISTVVALRQKANAECTDSSQIALAASSASCQRGELRMKRAVAAGTARQGTNAHGASHPFRQVVHWKLEELGMLLGTDQLVFSTSEYPAMALQLRHQGLKRLQGKSYERILK